MVVIWAKNEREYVAYYFHLSIWAVLTALYYLYQLEPRIVEFKDMRAWTFLEEQSAVSKVSPLSTQKYHHSKIPPIFYKYIFLARTLACGGPTAHCFRQQHEPPFHHPETPFTYAYHFGISGLLARWYFCSTMSSFHQKDQCPSLFRVNCQWQGRQQQFLLATLLLLLLPSLSFTPIAQLLSDCHAASRNLHCIPTSCYTWRPDVFFLFPL